MKRVRLYESFIKEAYKFYDLFFNSHLDHNPECDILEGHLDKDSLITYGIYVKGPKQGLEFMEYYSGSNYKPTSDKRSSSRLFMVDKIPAKYKAMWEDLKKIYEDEYAGSGRVSTRNESLVTEGQFSWMTQDTDTQIGSEKENTITVYMFSDKGERWEEKRYEGYGEFGGKDYYELLAQMNGVENADRQDGIDIAFGKKKVKGKVLFPALVQDSKFNWKRHDFTEEPANDPNQSWYQEPEYDDDDEQYDDYDESKVTEAKALPLDKLTKMIGDKPSCYSLADFVYTNYDKVTGLKKSMRNDEMDFPSEIMDLVDHYGFDVDDFTDKYSMAAESLNVDEKEVNLFDEVGPELEALRSKISGLMKKSEDDKWTSALGKALSALSTLDRNLSQADSKLGVVPVNESAMSDIDLMAQEAKDFKSFVKEFKKEYKNMDAGSAKELEAWLQSVYDGAKTNESVVNEGDMTKEYDGFVVLDTKTKKSYKFKYIKGSKSVNVENDAIAKLMKSTGESRATFMVHGFVKKGEWDKSEFEVLESKINEAKDVKSEVIDKLSQFFGVSTGALIKFNFDGKDDIRALTKALNGTDYEGVDNIVRIAVIAAKRDLGIEESVVTEGKDDFMARHSGTDIWLKKGYKHHNEDELQKLYFKIGELLKDELSVKSVSVVFEGKTNEAVAPAGLTKAETKKVAETYAKAISKHDGVKCTVNAKSLEEDSFDLDIDGEEYAGGSYMITLDGDVINAALPEKPVYGQIDSTVDQIIKNLKK